MILKFFIRNLAFVLLAVWMMGCTAIPDAGTRIYVYDKMRRVQTGNNPEQVIYLMDGPPGFVTSLRSGADIFDIWEYRVGNFLYSQTAIILFKNSQVLAMPKHSQELIGILYSHGIVREAQFWNNKEA